MYGITVSVYSFLVDSLHIQLCNIDSCWYPIGICIMNNEHGTNSTVYSYPVDLSTPVFL